MVISSEQDSVETEPSIKAIAIKLPFDLQERLLSFPFLHALREKYPRAEIHFITPRKNIEVLNLLPFTAYYHEFDEDEIQTVFDVHRFAANAKILNIDLYISLTNSFVDGCLGIALRAKRRLGFSDGWKTLLFNEKTPRPQGLHISDDFFALYRAHLGELVNTKIKVMSRELQPVISDWDSLPYVAINLSPLRDVSIENEWIELISHFENQRIILFASEDQDKIQVLMEPFIAKLSKKNIYINFVYKSWIDLAKMLAFAKGVITYNGPLASMSAYTGSKTIILYDQEDPQRYGPFYFLSDIVVMGTNNPTLVNTTSPQSGVLKNRVTFNMTEVFAKAMDFFRLS